MKKLALLVSLIAVVLAVIMGIQTKPQYDAKRPSPAIKKELKPFIPATDVLSDDDQAFFDSFYQTYEKYLFVDGAGSVCNAVLRETGVSITEKLERIATQAGYTMPGKEEMLSLANNIIASCKDGTIKDKADIFQDKFDEVFPYKVK